MPLPVCLATENLFIRRRYDLTLWRKVCERYELATRTRCPDFCRLQVTKALTERDLLLVSDWLVAENQDCVLFERLMNFTEGFSIRRTVKIQPGNLCGKKGM